MRVLHRNDRDYRLPNDLNHFQEQLYIHLIDWKRANVTDEPGVYVYHGKPIRYDAILPDRYEAMGEMPHIYPSVRPVLMEHRKRNPFRIHPHFYHMSSSQAANVNLFLPLLVHPAASVVLAAIRGAPRDFARLDTEHLDKGFCLEYWGGNYTPEDSGAGLLRDKGPQSGTDSDIAIAYRNTSDEPCIWLIEHKLTEPEFSTCGGFKSPRRDPARHRCELSFTELLANRRACYQHDVRNFAYWDLTADFAAHFPNHDACPGCPFQGGMNQLWRNLLLALAIERDGRPFKHAHFSVVRHARNRALDDTLSTFSRLTGASSKFSTFSSADVLTAVERYADASLMEWVEWYRALYSPDVSGTDNRRSK